MNLEEALRREQRRQRRRQLAPLTMWATSMCSLIIGVVIGRVV